MTNKELTQKNSFLQKMQEKGKGREMKYFFFATVVLLYVTAFLCAGPVAIIKGIVKIVMSRDALITDYFALAGYGAAFCNVAIVATICVVLILVEKVPFTGPTLAALFINIGYGFWGKNPVNILPTLLGTYLYARLHHKHFGRYIYTALFGTCLAPFVTELVYMLPFSRQWNLVIAVVVSVFIGFILPPLSMHTASMHMGYSLFNVGFSAGVLAFVLCCVLRSFGLESEPVLIWQEGRPVWLAVFMYAYFAVTFLAGFFLSGKSIKKLFAIFRHPGRAVADFVLMDGPGTTLMNMSVVGILGLTYIFLIGGDLSGPVIGAVFMAFGFASFGVHVKNYLPVLAGVVVFNLLSHHNLVDPGIQLAALFAVGLAPIAGQFGIAPGAVSGMLHSAVVMCTADMYGGLNLYNNGFSSGWVAIFMVPTVESFMNHFETRKRQKNKNVKRTESERT